MFYFATESGDHVIKVLICDWSVFNVVVVFVRWRCKFCLYFWLLKLFNLFSLFNMSWTDSQIESLITFYSSVLVSGARNFATGVKNRRQKPTPVFWRQFLERVSSALGRTPRAISHIFLVWVSTVAPHLYSGFHPDKFWFGEKTLHDAPKLMQYRLTEPIIKQFHYRYKQNE